MYPNPYGANAYSQASQNVSSMKAVVMLYEGVIRLVGEAKVHHEAGDYEARFQAIEKASRVILGLQGQLDFENGGDISPILHEFYNNIFMRMMQINSRNPEPIIEDVISSLTHMKETWIEVALKTEAKGVDLAAKTVSSGGGGMEVRTQSASYNV